MLMAPAPITPTDCVEPLGLVTAVGGNRAVLSVGASGSCCLDHPSGAGEVEKPSGVIRAEGRRLHLLMAPAVGVGGGSGTGCRCEWGGHQKQVLVPGKRRNSSFEGWVKTSVIISSTPGLA
ncbi:hypothetical protein MDA_GLEAN10022534 [Myotis davidii]|uniref:Uncharacterized protein n=1 Tax=Myotis davidii TaxID=225400 RepID=L5MF83_MYODS|nr:hypothetical protein MDA_GLEAN10022534 [Myotis davidii]